MVSYSAASGIVAMYNAVCESFNGGARATGNSTTTSAMVTGLTLGATYTCRVTAVNDAGRGPESEDSEEIITM